MKRLMVPPLPAASRPSNSTVTRSFASLIQDCAFSSSTCRGMMRVTYSFSVSRVA